MTPTSLCASLLALLCALLASHAGAGECPSFQAGTDGLPDEGEWRTHPDLGDVDGDGYLDLAAYPRKGAGPGVWLWQPESRAWKKSSTGLAIPSFSCGVGIDLADLNGDELLDVAVADHCSGVYAFVGDGGKLWRMHASLFDRDSHGYDDIQVFPPDADGQVALVAIGSFRGGFSLLRADSRGAFRSVDAKEHGLPRVGYGSDLELGDVNGDGRIDIAAAYTGDKFRKDPATQYNPVWIATGNGRFEPAGTGLFDEGRAYGVSLGDVNGDGLDDLAVTRDRAPGLHVFLRTAEGGWQESNEGLSKDARYQGVKLADATGDGLVDLVAMEFSNARIRLFRGDGAGAWEECEGTGLPAEREEKDIRGWGLEVGDIDRDGRPDIVAGMGRNKIGALEAWFGAPPSPVEPPAPAGSEAPSEDRAPAGLAR